MWRLITPHLVLSLPPPPVRLDINTNLLHMTSRWVKQPLIDLHEGCITLGWWKYLYRKHSNA